MLKGSLRGVHPPCLFHKCLNLSTYRSISFNTAINKGIRKANDRSSKIGIRTSPDAHNESSRPSRIGSSRIELGRGRDTTKDARRTPGRHRRRNEQAFEVSHDAPLGKPYTTAGSEFLYGAFPVKAALEAGRRNLYKLYIWTGQESADDQYDRSLHQLAKAKRVPVQFVSGNWDKMLLKMSNQRPHNGLVMEASPIPKLPILSMMAMEDTTSTLQVQVAAQSLEDQKANSIFQTPDSTSSSSVLPRVGDQNRFPLLLWLDRITDTGNLGAIMRTAQFLGVDAILVPEHGTAPFSPITVKASAGAAEMVPIMVVRKELDFINKSQQNGWRFIAAVAPDSPSTWKRLSEQGSFVAELALEKNPCILMVGNEGEGLRPAMQKAADNFVSIRGVKGPANGVDSLNVSVAAALLVARLLSKPSSQRTKGVNSPPETKNVEADSESMF